MHGSIRLDQFSLWRTSSSNVHAVCIDDQSKATVILAKYCRRQFSHKVLGVEQMTIEGIQSTMEVMQNIRCWHGLCDFIISNSYNVSSICHPLQAMIYWCRVMKGCGIPSKSCAVVCQLWWAGDFSRAVDKLSLAVCWNHKEGVADWSQLVLHTKAADCLCQ